MAAKAPSTIEAIETNTTICCHSCVMRGKPHGGTYENSNAGDFRCRGKECRHRVGAPS